MHKRLVFLIFMASACQVPQSFSNDNGLADQAGSGGDKVECGFHAVGDTKGYCWSHNGGCKHVGENGECYTTCEDTGGIEHCIKESGTAYDDNNGAQPWSEEQCMTEEQMTQSFESTMSENPLLADCLIEERVTDDFRRICELGRVKNQISAGRFNEIDESFINNMDACREYHDTLGSFSKEYATHQLDNVECEYLGKKEIAARLYGDSHFSGHENYEEDESHQNYLVIASCELYEWKEFEGFECLMDDEQGECAATSCSFRTDLDSGERTSVLNCYGEQCEEDIELDPDEFNCIEAQDWVKKNKRPLPPLTSTKDLDEGVSQVRGFDTLEIESETGATEVLDTLPEHLMNQDKNEEVYTNVVVEIIEGHESCSIENLSHFIVTDLVKHENELGTWISFRSPPLLEYANGMFRLLPLYSAFRPAWTEFREGQYQGHSVYSYSSRDGDDIEHGQSSFRVEGRLGSEVDLTINVSLETPRHLCQDLVLRVTNE